MADNPIRFGIIGCVKIASKVARAINLAPSAILYAVGDSSMERAKQFVAANGVSDTVVKVYGSYREVIDDPSVDVVYVPLPPSLRAQWGVLAAQKKKHLLLEKPTALDAAELDQVLGACESNGVQFMDGTLWLHHPRTAKIREMLLDSQLLGNIHYIYSTMTTSVPPEFLDKLSIDALGGYGVVGELGWYNIGAVLWAKGYELPTSVTALPDVTKNSSGVIVSCTASLQYDREHKTTATIHCSFLSHLSMDLAVTGSGGSLHLKDFIIPFQEHSASFDFTLKAKFVELHVGWNVKPERVVVACEQPQEVMMVQELSELVNDIRDYGRSPERKWPETSRKTQLVLDAVKKSVDLGCTTVYL